MRGSQEWHERIGEAIADTLTFVPKIVLSAYRKARDDFEVDQPRQTSHETFAVVEPIQAAPTNVVSWVREFEARNGRKPQIPEVQSEFPEIPRTTLWRRIKSA